MDIKQINFRILRYKAEVIDPPEFYVYTLEVADSMSVLEALEKIRLTQEPTLMYRHSCHHSSCGTCACLINNTEGLMCTTNVWALGTDTVTLAALKGFPLLGDLVVNMNPFFKDIDEDWTYLRPSIQKKRNGKPAGTERPFFQFEDCIECGSCVSACPVSRDNSEFIGPAALTAMHREMGKNSSYKKRLLRQAKNERGALLCDRALQCSRVCPTAVYPARHIVALKKMILNR